MKKNTAPKKDLAPKPDKIAKTQKIAKVAKTTTPDLTPKPKAKTKKISAGLDNPGKPKKTTTSKSGKPPLKA